MMGSVWTMGTRHGGFGFYIGTRYHRSRREIGGLVSGNIMVLQLTTLESSPVVEQMNCKVCAMRVFVGLAVCS